MKIDLLVLKLWSKKQFQMKNLGFRSDNHGKNCWHTSSDLGEKNDPSPPKQCWSESCCKKPVPDPPTLTDGGGEGLW